jgi:serine/threonine protein kinase
VDKAGKTPLDYAFESKHHHIIDYDRKTTVTLYTRDHKGAQLKLKPDDFEFVMPLGRGAFGEVILVHDRVDTSQDSEIGEKESKLYAMKIMKKRKYNGLINFVLTEKEVQRKVRHKFIVKLAYAF